jgi:hypothetical protein
MRTRGFFLLTTAVLLVGIAQLLVLPPFEGFDETAHYSYVLEIADTRAIPVFGRSTIAKVVQDYHRWGPMPYTSVPPFNENGAGRIGHSRRILACRTPIGNATACPTSPRGATSPHRR